MEITHELHIDEINEAMSQTGNPTGVLLQIGTRNTQNFELLKIVGRPWWWILLFLIPIVNLVILILTYNDLSKSFGKGVGFTIGLLLLSFIFFPILGFGSARYIGPAGTPGAGPAVPPPPPPPMPTM